MQQNNVPFKVKSLVYTIFCICGNLVLVEAEQSSLVRFSAPTDSMMTANPIQCEILQQRFDRAQQFQTHKYIYTQDCTYILMYPRTNWIQIFRMYIWILGIQRYVVRTSELLFCYTVNPSCKGRILKNYHTLNRELPFYKVPHQFLLK